MIIFANVHIPLENYQFSITFFLILWVAIYLYVNLEKRIYHLMISFMMMIGYVGLLLWNFYTPLWLFIHELILVPLFCNVIILLFVRGIWAKIAVLLFGMVAGELFSHLIFTSYGLLQTIGSLQFFDQLFISLITLLILHSLQWSIQRLYDSLHVYKQRKVQQTITFE